MDKIVFVDFETKICSAFLNAVSDTVWDALGEAKTPQAARIFIGAVEEAPTDGAMYLRSNASWQSATTSLQHNDLAGRSQPDAHPIAAITGLQSDLDLINQKNTDQDAAIALKADKTYVDIENDAQDTLISNNTAAIATKADQTYVNTLDAANVKKTSNTGTALIPAGTEAQRDVTPALGAIRFSSTAVGWEGWNGTNWAAIGGGQIDWISVKDFGAKGDGVTDDTAAIQAALDFIANKATGIAEGGTLHFPAGYYKISAPLQVVDQVVISGEGGESTKIATTTGAVFNVTSPSVRVQDMFFSSGTTGDSVGIRFVGGNNCVIENCTFQNQVTGIELDSCYSVEALGCIFDVCYSHGIVATTSSHNISIERCGFFSCGVRDSSQAVSFGVATDNIRIVSNDFENCYVNIRLNGCSAVIISGNYFEYQTQQCFDITGMSYGVSIDHNWIAAGAAETIDNIAGGNFTGNTLWNQNVSFSSASLASFTVGTNKAIGTSVLQTQPWIAPTLTNSWAQQTNYTPVGYMKDEDGWVHLRGGLVGGVVPNALFTLPVGYRPSLFAVFATAGPNGICAIAVNVDGTVVPQIAPGNNPFLDGISFKLT